MVSAFWRVAVVILAVQDRPGRISSGGSSMATTTLKSLASWLETALWEAARPVERRMAVLPISMTWPLKVLLGMGSTVMSAVTSSARLTMAVSSTFPSAVIRDMSAIVMMLLPGVF